MEQNNINVSIQTNKHTLYKGDCLEIMERLIEQGVKVDLILCDPPYGTTACKWDSVIPLEEMWNKFRTDNYFVGELTWKEVSMFDVEIMKKYLLI